jgi:branched-chain amino acid transport system substrate-binding protein
MLKRRAFTASLAAVATVPAVVRAQASVYKIGVTYPLTGPLAINSPQVIAGAQIAIDDINRAGGVKGHQVALAVEDSLGTPQGGVTAMRKLVEVDGVQAILTIFTNIVTAQMPLGDALKVPTLSTVETPGLVGQSKYSFAHAATLGSASMLGTFWKNNAKKVFALYGDNGFGHLIAPVAKQIAQGAGCAYDEAFFDLTATDFRGLVTRVKDAGADWLFISGQGSSAETALIKQLRELGLTTPIVNGSNFYYDKTWATAVGSYAEGMYFVGVNVDATTPYAKTFVTAYKAKVGNEPSYQAGEAYDIIRMFATCIERAGYTGEGIRNQLAVLKGLPSVLGGTITMGEDHYTLTSGYALWQVKNGVEVKVNVNAKR